MKHPIKHPAFYMDSSACTGCKTCMVACVDGRNLPEGVLWRRVAEYSGGDWIRGADGSWSHSVFAYYVSVSCNHCEAPACMAVCPAQAVSKDENGIVRIDPALCTGCGRCRKHCPYSAPCFDKKLRVMTKCDGCADRLAAGKQPLCVESCPMRALRFGEYEELKERFGDAGHIAPLPEQALTRPRLLFTPPRAAGTHTSRGTVANPEEM
ncbi:4Fe-4S dicluster domain-containing protein [Desulfovibrio sp. OttesenSCG-928-I05]|nr:4Fe-4S dicluster domain-containing protein [Desulfovibrio sp. OttesenSCG-928-I05]